jgi:hypothetical protein
MLNTDQATIVLAANTFNVSIFQQAWLLENEVIRREEFSGGDNIFTPMAVNISNSDFSFLVVPERIQLVAKRNFNQAGQNFSRIIGKIADCLPHSPISALGLNFDFSVPISEADEFFTKHRELFVCSSNPLGDFFTSEDTRFGVYLSKNYLDGRLRLDMKPVMRGETEHFKLSFNYHRDIASMKEIHPILNMWDDIFAYVQSISVELDKNLEE